MFLGAVSMKEAVCNEIIRIHRYALSDLYEGNKPRRIEDLLTLVYR